jgi:hypothetical protein
MLRSIKDVNEPKFLAPDVPLFHGILSDLFPGELHGYCDCQTALSALSAGLCRIKLPQRLRGWLLFRQCCTEVVLSLAMPHWH